MELKSFLEEGLEFFFGSGGSSDEPEVTKLMDGTHDLGSSNQSKRFHSTTPTTTTIVVHPTHAGFSGHRILPPFPPLRTPAPTPTPVLVSHRRLEHRTPTEPFSGETWWLKVVGGSESHSITPDTVGADTTYARPGMKFVVLQLEVANVTSSPVRWVSPFLLVDDHERTYPVHPETAWGLGEVLKRPPRDPMRPADPPPPEPLQPGRRLRATIAFEIPVEVEGYTLLARDGPTNRYASVRLRKA